MLMPGVPTCFGGGCQLAARYRGEGKEGTFGAGWREALKFSRCPAVPSRTSPEFSMTARGRPSPCLDDQSRAAHETVPPVLSSPSSPLYKPPRPFGIRECGEQGFDTHESLWRGWGRFGGGGRSLSSERFSLPLQFPQIPQKRAARVAPYRPYTHVVSELTSLRLRRQLRRAASWLLRLLPWTRLPSGWRERRRPCPWLPSGRGRSERGRP